MSRLEEKMKKFNIIDGIVLLMVIVALVGAYWYVTKDDSEVAIDTGKTEVLFVAQAEGVLESTLDQLKVGDQIIGNGYVEDATIVDIVIEQSSRIEAVDGELVLLEIPNKKRITVTIKGMANKYGPYIDLAGQEIKGGSKYTVRTEFFEANGIILTIVDKDKE